MKVLRPKFSKKANEWCVTVFEGKKQEVKWFITLQEAIDFYKEK